MQNCFFKSVGAVVDAAVWVRGVDKDEAWKQGFVAFPSLPLAGRAQRAHRVAVIAPMSRDDLVATGSAAVFTLCLELTRHLKRGFVGFRATVGEVDATGVAEEVTKVRQFTGPKVDWTFPVAQILRLGSGRDSKLLGVSSRLPKEPDPARRARRPNRSLGPAVPSAPSMVAHAQDETLSSDTRTSGPHKEQQRSCPA